ncbi:S41 family peptidase [Flavitalea sp. BT771]|uniref:S41 family peptidase n=1 Tax=Flavitalea sp. BT771 TaxID=3063329 RepID=UPI0026E24C94|nr:S41 family peptidase [Flavitalea sp. BT771]MDO6433146.1 S41 family peptidase [Flavitalea sp. BT771]MDV6221578.1 S41 family peptidase [Flavitalea sp. BT771]
MNRIFLILALLFIGCKKVQLPPGASSTGPPSDFNGVFEMFWNNMNTNYVFWDLDTTRWDAVYTRYQPLFARLDLQRSEDVKTSLQYFRDMTQGLLDGHYSITFSNAFIAGSAISPGYERLRKRPDFHPLFPYAANDIGYLDAGYKEGYDSSEYPSHLLHVISGTIDHTILYFTCNEFSLFKSSVSPVHNAAQDVLQYFFSRLSDPSLKGMIIDLRGNTGGDLSDLNFLAGHLFDQPLHFGYTRSKGGNGRLDYTPWVDAVVTPVPGAQKFQLPLMVLADIFSASLAEQMTMALRSLPGTTVIGETTRGATGAITANDVYNAGPFTVPGFLSVYTASAEFKYLDGRVYEGKGFPPDIPISFDLVELTAGKDPALEKAVSMVK